MKITTVQKIVFAFLVTGMCGLIQAQDKPVLKKRQKPEDFWKKSFVGINLTPSFGYGAFQIYASPTLGYRITDNFNAAAGPLYMFFRQSTNIGNINASIWGGRLWAQHRIYRTFYAHAEYEVMGAIRSLGANGTIERQTIGNPLAGAAFVTESESGFQSLTILYNLNYIDGVTPYGTLLGISIVFRVGWCFNLGGNR